MTKVLVFGSLGHVHKLVQCGLQKWRQYCLISITVSLFGDVLRAHTHTHVCLLSLCGPSIGIIINAANYIMPTPITMAFVKWWKMILEFLCNFVFTWKRNYQPSVIIMTD